VTSALHVDGHRVSVPDGMTLSAVLIRAGVRAVGVNAISGEPRGPFCGMGVCFECEVTVDNRVVRACLTPAADGMVVKTEASR
jgi:predicted molibdopterin-dependent oxidoreductase YjgC